MAWNTIQKKSSSVYALSRGILLVIAWRMNLHFLARLQVFGYLAKNDQIGLKGNCGL